MTASVRGEKRRARERRRSQPEKCYVCGREGQRRSLTRRNQQWTCRERRGCMDRVLLPQSEPPTTWDMFAKIPPPPDDFSGWHPIGYLSDEGTQQ